jgi:A/G-specific adenine glycosylase
MIKRFPDVRALAEAEEDEVMKYWQGLGYYSRARNLHEAAKMVMRDFAGKFPGDYESLRKLKGVGEYTAAAIISFVWNQPYAVVDGNVFRFLSRFFAIDIPINSTQGKKYFTELAGHLIDRKQPGLFNQAIMEFGALQCVPVSPSCHDCPFVSKCLAYATNSVGKYPVKEKKTKVRTRYFHYFHIRQGEYTFIKKRTGTDIWKNLYEFPVIETEQPASFEDMQENESFQMMFPDSTKASFRLLLDQKKHVLTHRILFVDFYEVFLDENLRSFPSECMGELIKIKSSDLDTYPVHRLMQFYLEQKED